MTLSAAPSGRMVARSVPFNQSDRTETGYVNSTPEFTAQSQVMNGASDLFVQVFGEAGRHTRMAVGVSALPYDVAVEVEAVFEVR